MDVPFSKEGSEPAYLDQIKEVFRRHPQSTIIWAHTGMGRIVRPVKNHAAAIEAILGTLPLTMSTSISPGMRSPNVLVSTPEATRVTADLINRYPNRFLFGTDEVAPQNQAKYLKVFYQYGTPMGSP